MRVQGSYSVQEKGGGTFVGYRRIAGKIISESYGKDTYGT